MNFSLSEDAWGILLAKSGTFRGQRAFHSSFQFHTTLLNEHKLLIRKMSAMPFLENSAGDRLEAHKKVEKGSQNSSDGKQNLHHTQLQQQWMIYQPVYNLYNLYKKLMNSTLLNKQENWPDCSRHSTDRRTESSCCSSYSQNFKVSHVLH